MTDTPKTALDKIESLLRLTHAAGKLGRLIGDEEINTEKVEDMLLFYKSQNYLKDKVVLSEDELKKLLEMARELEDGYESTCLVHYVDEVLEQARKL